MKVTLSYTLSELEQAQRAQAVLVKLFGCCRVHSSRSGDRCMIYLTFRF
ncbi:MAG TPA: hypothetical protein OIM12_00810 [Faecalibacterium prausnitzii]|nr:hypothetical protein [Faecalibacterium prausnitzii]